MFAKRLVLLLTTFAVTLMYAAVSYAEGTAVLSQAYTWEQNIDVYVAGEMNLETLSCKVSNQAAEVVDSGLLADRGVTVRTTILLDISTSMPPELRDGVKTYIDTLIQNIGKNEQYKIMTFGEQLTILQDFTADRYDLSHAAGKIEFNGQQSKIYDAIYNTMPKPAPVDGSPCYYRTVVITDGVDDTATGVTKEELYLRLQADTYPIDVVAVSKAKQAEQEKELSALTRMSGGKYTNLHPESDLSALSSEIAVKDIFWLRAIIPVTLLDGSTRSFVVADETTSLQFDVKVPVFDAPAAETPATETPATESESAPVPVTAEPAAHPQTTSPTAAPTPVQKEGMSGEYSTVVFIGAGVGLTVLTAVTAAFAIVHGRRKKGQETASTATGGGTFTDKTEILGGGNPGNFASGTGGSLCVRLRNVNNPDQIWNLSLSTAVIIGRDTDCQACIPESSVSRQQCKLYLANHVPTAENVSKSNITQLNGEPLHSPHPIKEGDKLKCGRVTLMVDSLYGSDSNNAGNLNKMTGFVNV